MNIQTINLSSLRYRIALMLVTLTTLMVGYILWETLSFNAEQVSLQLNETDKVTVDLLADLSGISIFTMEYDSIQSHVDRISNDPRVNAVYVVDAEKLILASSHLEQIGETLSALSDSENTYWISRRLGDQGNVHVQFSNDRQQEIADKTRALAIKIGVIGITIIALVGVMLGRVLTIRLSSLTSAVRAYNFETGEVLIDKNLLQSKDEVGELARTFEMMHLHIIDYTNKIKQETEERNSAQLANQVKSDFMANMSHELRTPLNAIIGYSELMMDLCTDREESNYDDLSKILMSGQHLLKLIDDILDLSKIEAGKVELDYSFVDLKDILKQATRSIYPQMLKKKNKLIVNIDPNIDVAYFDETKVKQVMLNLLSNACKFTDSGVINLDSYIVQNGDALYYAVEIRDSGIGMTDKQIEEVFNPYVQADSSTTRLFGGTGLGLTISKQYCELMGCTIELSSELGKGTKFMVTLPVPDPASENNSRSNAV